MQIFIASMKRATANRIKMELAIRFIASTTDVVIQMKVFLTLTKLF